MKAIKAKARQTLFDISIQEFGSMEASFEIMKLNPACTGITMDLPEGTILKIDNSSENANTSVRDYLATEKIASGTPLPDPENPDRFYSDEYDETQYS